MCDKRATEEETTASKSSPIPGWPSNIEYAQIQNYESYFAHQLRVRFLELSEDFRVIKAEYEKRKKANNDVFYFDEEKSDEIARLLEYARKSLECNNPKNLLAISSTLDVVVKHMVWITPLYRLKFRIISIKAQLEEFNKSRKSNYIGQLNILLDKCSNEINDLEAKQSSSENLKPGDSTIVRASVNLTLNDAIDVFNKQALDQSISSGLQLNRLEMLRLWGLVMLTLFLIISPIATNLEALKIWPTQSLSGILAVQIPILGNSLLIELPFAGPKFLLNLICALSVTAMGVAGGFLSGLLQVRNSRVDLAQYQESMLKFQLRLIVGGFISMILYVLLSWQIVPGVEIKNAGTYLLIAFLSGFSERYFLKLLDLKADGDETKTVNNNVSIDRKDDGI